MSEEIGVPPADQRKAIRIWIGQELDAGRIVGERPEDVAIRATDELGFDVAPLSVHAAFLHVSGMRRISKPQPPTPPDNAATPQGDPLGPIQPDSL